MQNPVVAEQPQSVAAVRSTSILRTVLNCPDLGFSLVSRILTLEIQAVLTHNGARGLSIRSRIVFAGGRKRRCGARGGHAGPIERAV